MRESSSLAYGSVRAHPARSVLAITGVVIGIVTVVLVATVLANVRNQIALLFRELGTDNVFAFHLTGDPYAPASDLEARRRPLERAFGRAIERLYADQLAPYYGLLAEHFAAHVDVAAITRLIHGIAP